MKSLDKIQKAAMCMNWWTFKKSPFIDQSFACKAYVPYHANKSVNMSFILIV